MNFKRTLLTTFVLLISFVTQQADAQQSHPLSRFLDTNTIAFGRLNLESIKPQAIYDEFLPVIKDYDRLSEKADLANSQAKGAQKKLLEAGAADIYGFFSLSDMTSGVFYVIPCDKENAQDVESVVNLLKKKLRRFIPDHQISRVPEGILIATDHTTRRLAIGFLPVREDASEVLNLADSSFDIILAPSADHLKAIRESIGPPFPDYAGKIFTEGGIDGDLIADGMRKTVLSFDAESMKLELKVQGIEDCPPGEEERLKAVATLASKFQWTLDQMRTGQVPFWPRAKRMGELPESITSMLKEIEINQTGNQISISFERSRLLPLAGGLAKWTDELLGLTRKTFYRTACRTILLATHNFESAFMKFPPKNIMDDEGKPLLSWRVAILPFMGDEGLELYNKFKLNEPWDSKHNKKLVMEIPEVFTTDIDLAQAGKTVWTIPQGENFIGSCMKMGDIIDGTSNTILLLSTTPENSMVWTQPVDFEPNLDDLKDGILSESEDAPTAGFADGSIHLLRPDLSNEALMALLTFAGGEVVVD